MAGKSRFNHSLAEFDQLSLAEKRQTIRSLGVRDDIDDLEQLNLKQQDEWLEKDINSEAKCPHFLNTNS